jgi:Gamma tubulin complex component C-terminal
MDLVIKRLSLTRFGMLHSINSLHNHLMVMLHGISLQLDAKVSKAQNISQLIACHEAFVDAFHAKSFFGPESASLNAIIIETLKLAKVLKEEWVTVTSFAALDETGSVDTFSLQDLDNNAMEIEKSFGVCEYRMKFLLDI